MAKVIEMVGKQFGRLKVIARSELNYKNGEARWIAICQCSKQTIVTMSGNHLRMGHKKHCGCILEPENQEYWDEIKKRIDKNCEIKGNCIEWTGWKNKLGYGFLSISKKGIARPIAAHRANWIVNVGKIPMGYEVCHKCDNPSCIRLDHLFLGTHAQNMKDCKDKDRYARGEKHPNAKFTEIQIREILLLRKKGMTYLEISKIYSAKKGTVLAICYKQNWKHIEIINENIAKN